MKLKNTRKRYGLFYKSRGKWTGPHGGVVAPKDIIEGELKLLKNVLKSKVEVRRVRFA